MSKQTDEIAALRKRIEELEAKAAPPEPKKPFVPMSDAEHRDWVYQMQERRMSMATPPSVVRDFAALDDKLVKEIALRDARAPTGRPGMIPDSPQPSPRLSVGDGTGWAREIPIGPPPGVAQADRLMDAQDARDRAVLIEREARLKAMQKVTEQIETMRQQTEALAKLAERSKK
jgi:hypothetical protein